MADRRIAVSRVAKINSVRPAVDPLFERLVAAFGPRVSAAMLTGMGRDGAADALAISRAGGALLAQNPAVGAGRMPNGIIGNGAADFVLSLDAPPNSTTALVMVPEATTHFSRGNPQGWTRYRAASRGDARAESLDP